MSDSRGARHDIQRVARAQLQSHLKHMGQVALAWTES